MSHRRDVMPEYGSPLRGGISGTSGTSGTSGAAPLYGTIKPMREPRFGRLAKLAALAALADSAGRARVPAWKDVTCDAPQSTERAKARSFVVSNNRSSMKMRIERRVERKSRVNG